MQKIWNKGHRIRASDKHLVYAIWNKGTIKNGYSQ